jgi:NitT/TauT family transport system permease protein/taurine transport system permease protein
MLRTDRQVRLAQAALLLAILVCWEVLPRADIVPKLFVPSLSEALGALAEDWHEYLSHLPTTLLEILAAYGIACGGGVTLGMLIASSARARSMVLPVLRAAYAVPLVVLYPVMMVWFGIGVGSKVGFAAIFAFVPTLLTTVAGVAALNPALLETGRAYGAVRWQQILYIQIPASLPTLVAALRLGGALVIVGVIVAEMLGAVGGIGFLITRHRTLLNSPGVYGGIILVLIITGGHEVLLRRLERRIERFRA